MTSRSLGLFKKFTVTRMDGQSAPGKKHDGCDYFVLDMTHDPHAIPALRAYADSAEADGYVELAVDLRRQIDYPRVRGARGAAPEPTRCPKCGGGIIATRELRCDTSNNCWVDRHPEPTS